MAKSSSSKSSKSTGIDLTMILLAVFVGLVVCSLMNGSVVEGATAIPTSGPKSGVCRGISGSQDDICREDTSARSAATCGGDKDVTGGVCRWVGYNDTYSYSGGLEGTVFDDWMMAVGIMDTSAKPSPASGNPMDKFGKTTMLPLGIKGRNKAGDLGSPSPQAWPTAVAGPADSKGGSPGACGAGCNSENFLAHIGVTTSKDALNNQYIPKSLQDEVQRRVATCESGWDLDGYDDSYVYNGGRPIMGYNAGDGLVCRNPLHYPIVLDGSEPRIWLGQEGDAPNNLGGCPDPTANVGGCEKRRSSCGWEDSAGYGAAIGQGLYNNLPGSSSGECGLDSCAARYPQQCAKTNLVAAAQDTGGWIVNNIPAVPAIA